MSVTTKTTELEAVNAILATANLPKISSLSPAPSDGTDAEVAYTALKEAFKALNAEGWVWNTEYQVDYSPSGGAITVGTDVVQIRPSGEDTHRNIALRDTALYDLDENTATFTGDVTLDIVKLMAWDDIPEAARLTAQYEAAVMFLERNYPDSQMIGWAARRAQDHRAKLEQMESESADRNLYHNFDVAKVFVRPWPNNSVYLD